MSTFRLKRADSDTETSIVLFVSLSGVRIKLYTRKKIDPVFWIKEFQRASEDLKDFLLGRQINLELKRLKNIADDMLNTLQITKGIMTAQQFKDAFEERAFKNIKLKKKNIAAERKRFAKSLVKPVKKKYVTPFFLHYGEFMKKLNVSIGRKRHYAVVYRMLQRYEMYTEMSSGLPFTLSMDKLTGNMIRDFVNFLQIEVELFVDFKELYRQLPEKRKPQKRGGNRIIGVLKTLRSYIIYCNANGLTSNDPFKNRTVVVGDVKKVIEGYIIGSEKYGDPIYITVDERNMLYKFDLSDRLDIEIYRDLFIFQSQVGCRVGDLYGFTYENLIEGSLHYIPGKGEEHKQTTLEVPLTETAMKLIEKYLGRKGDDRLFPFPLEQDYNEGIKDVFKLVGLTRNVLVLNSVTGKKEFKSLDEVVTSHMARRTFIGNIYNAVKDPNLIGSMTGHSEGSRAFGRYRKIDGKIKKDTLDLIK